MSRSKPMFTPSETEPSKPKPSLIQLKVSLQEVEACLLILEETADALGKKEVELGIRRDNLRALIREQE